MRGRQIIWILLIPVMMAACVKPFNPPAVASANLNLLVVDGFINPTGASTIKLSRTLNITDSFQVVPESNAQLYLEGQSGSSLSFQSGFGNIYTCPTSFLPADDKYRLRIVLENGNEYLSDYADVKISPPIDSIEWEESETAVSILANTHDPSGKARYYKWDFEETSEYRATYEALIDYIDGQFVILEPEQFRYVCFKYYTSTSINLGTSSTLSDDVVRRVKITEVPTNDTKISTRYSILVKQYALTPEAFKFWQVLKSNTEQNGNIFDPQPAQLRSNIHNTADPNEPVIGFFSISNVSEQRIFIRAGQLRNKPGPPFSSICDVTFINPEEAALFLTPTSGLKPAYFSRTSGLAIAPAICVDCRLQGGTTQKPSYW